eukprot:4996856-Amphidinium_carterae.1
MPRHIDASYALALLDGALLIVVSLTSAWVKTPRVDVTLGSKAIPAELRAMAADFRVEEPTGSEVLQHAMFCT